MTNEKILELLAETECELFHLSADNPKNEEYRNAHKAANEALIAFAKAIGRYN